MPCYNGSSYIKYAIDSVIMQTYTDWELLITDDCSSDSCDTIIKEYMKNDARIKLFSTKLPSGSPVEPRNICLDNAKGDYIAFLDCDDIWKSDKLNKQLDLFKDKTVSIVFSDYEKIDKEGNSNNRIIRGPKKVSYRKFLKGDCIGTSTAVVKREALGNIRFKKIGAEDYLFFIEILRNGAFAQNTQTVEVYYRQDKQSLSGNKFKSAKWNWNIYRNELKLNLFASLYFFIFYAVKGFIKFLK